MPMPSPTARASSPAGGAENPMLPSLPSLPSSDEVVAEIARVCREELELERAISPGDDLLADLALDSMGLIVLAVGLENRFRVKLSEEDSVGVKTVGDLAALVLRRVAESLETAR